MRIISYKKGALDGIGLWRNGRYVGVLENETGYEGSLDALIASGPEALERAAAALASAPEVDMSQVRLMPPLRSPGKIICVGLNYSEHTKESGYDQPDYPALFPRFTSSLIAHEEPMIRPRVSDTLDFEGELAVIIGHHGRHISIDAALDHVAGYSIFNDGSVREYQFKSPQWTVGKNFDGTGAFGPEFVSADELPLGARGLLIETRLNGEAMQHSNTDMLIFDVASLVALISEAITLAPGDVIVTGTPSGIGHARDPKIYMRDGDVCEVEIQGIGVLRNTIRDEPLQ